MLGWRGAPPGVRNWDVEYWSQVETRQQAAPGLGLMVRQYRWSGLHLILVELTITVIPRGA